MKPRSWISLLLITGILGACSGCKEEKDAGATKVTSPVTCDKSSKDVVGEFLRNYSAEEQKAIAAQGYDHDELETLLGIDREMAESLVKTAIEAENFKPLAASVTIGEPKKWIKLHEWSQTAPRDWYQVLCGDFEAAPGQEVLFVARESRLIHVTAASSRILDAFPPPILAWDFGADKKDELVREIPHYTSETGRTWMKVYDVDDQHVHSFEASRCGPRIIVGDYDGDGQADLMMSESLVPEEEGGLIAFNYVGEKIFELPVSWNTPQLVAADVDGDGRDEIIRTSISEAAHVAGIDQDVIQLQETGGRFHFSPIIGVDLNGDGYD